MPMSREQFSVYARLLNAAGERVLTAEEIAELNALT